MMSGIDEHAHISQPILVHHIQTIHDLIREVGERVVVSVGGEPSVVILRAALYREMTSMREYRQAELALASSRNHRENKSNQYDTVTRIKDGLQ